MLIVASLIEFTTVNKLNKDKNQLKPGTRLTTVDNIIVIRLLVYSTISTRLSKGIFERVLFWQEENLLKIHWCLSQFWSIFQIKLNPQE